MPLWEKILKSIFPYKEKGVVKLSGSREASGSFLEPLDLAMSSATLEWEEMEAVIQKKNEKKF